MVSPINKHLWYLVKELVPLILFDDCTSQSVKAKVADALNHQINQESPVWSNEKPDLADFVGSNYMLFFILDCSHSFLI